VNDGMGNEYRQSRDIAPTQEQIEAYRKASRDSQLLYLKCVREYTAKGLSNWTREALEREEQRFRDIDTSTINGWFPAYHSVGVYLYNPLSPEALKVVIERAKEYCTKNNITLESVRLVTEYSYKTSE